MASARDIKRRIKSVKSTEQITKAMKMVSASKLRKSQNAVISVRPFTRKIDNMILHIGGEIKHPYLQGREHIKRVCYVVIGSDRGQCGGFNANLNRFLDHTLSSDPREYELVVIGRKVREHCLRRGYTMADEFRDIGDNPSFAQAQILATKLREYYDNETYDEISMVYSIFRSAMTQTPAITPLLPLPMPEPIDLEEEEDIFAETDYIFEPNKEEVLSAILPQ